MKLQTGAIVRVSGRPGEVFGQVADVRTPAELAVVPGFDTRQVRHALNDLGVTEFALITHLYGDQPVCFFALLTEDGEWIDLRGNQLEIEAVATEAHA